MNVFDYVKSINETKEDIMVDEVAEKTYAPFIVNRSLSYFSDTVFQANEMNMRQHLAKREQYRFLLSSIRKRKRWAGKWHKQEANADISVIMESYGYSEQKAREIYPLLSETCMQALRDRLDPGGIVVAKRKTKKS